MMRQDRAGGLSLRAIAASLNLQLIPTKQNGVWQANTVREILAHAKYRNHARPGQAAGSLIRGSVRGDCYPTRPNFPVGALILEEGQRHAARMPRVSGPKKGGRGKKVKG